MLKDLIRSLSLANLCFIITWNELLNSPVRRFNACLAIIVNVMLLAALSWSVVTLVRRSNSLLALRIVRFVFPLIILLPLNAILEILFPRMILLDALIIVGLAVVAMGLFEVTPWYQYILRASELVVIVLFPFSLIAIAQASYGLINPTARSKIPAVTAESQSNKRLLWLLFDEMDQHVAFSNRPASLNLPELDRLRSQALYATNVYAPADSTPVSVPAFITGKLLSKTKLVSQSKMIITYADSEKSVDWGSEPSLFSEAREEGFNTTLIGWYLPYCSLIGGGLTSCSWIDTEAVTLGESFSKQLQDLICTVPILSRFVIARGLETKKRRERRKLVESYVGALEAAQKAVADPNFGLVLVHWPVPHPPGIYDRRTDKFEIEGEASYLDNLQLVDKALGELRRKMEDAGTWDSSIVLLTSDHWWRTAIWRPTDAWSVEDSSTVKDETDHRVPFLLKLAGQKESLTYDPVFNNVLVHDLILALLSGKFSSPASVAGWLDQNRSIGESPYRFELPQ